MTSVLQSARSTWQRAESAARRHAAAYAADATDDRPLGGYLQTMSAYAGLAGTAALVSWRRGVRLPASVPPADVVLMGAATYQLTRIIGKDSITSPLRARFTRYVEPAGPGEVAEAPRGTGVTHAVGELVTCPFCLAQWVATGLVFGYLWQPRPTRWAMGMLSVVAMANLMQFVHARLDPE